MSATSQAGCLTSPRPSASKRTTVLVLFAAVPFVAGCGGATTTPNTNYDVTQDENITSKQHRMGAEIYATHCALCHDRGEAGAPRLGNAKQWKARAAKGNQTLVDNAFDGFDGQWGQMPPQSDELTRDQVRAAVDYMIHAYETNQTNE